MPTLSIYDPAMCCSSGACGPEADSVLIQFAAFVRQAHEANLSVQRYNLSQEPMAYVQNETVKALMEKEGTDALPLIFLDGQLIKKGAYLTEEEQKEILALSTSR